jgi:GNAT superfamily N-acetyltransferase
VRELKGEEFPLADAAWIHYHDTTGDVKRDRIFALFIGESIVSLARCRRYTDGLEVDGVFTLEEFRRRGYSHLVMTALEEACHNDDLYMYAVKNLTDFYTRFGFETILERDLPASIRERYQWAAGNLEGADVQPMKRRAGL